MAIRNMLAGLFVSVIFVFTTQSFAERSQAEQEIVGLEDKMNAIYAANDLPNYFAYYADDFTQWLPEGRTDLRYTYSKSIDLGSDTERVNSQGTTSTTSAIPLGTSTILSYIANSWNPGLNRAPSDFDLRHVITANWVYELPFGKGKTFAGNAGGRTVRRYRRLAALRFESLEQRVSVQRDR